MDILDQELCFQLYVASKEIIRLYKDRLAPFKLTYTGFITMLAINDTMSVSELGDKLTLDSGTLSPLLKKLEGNGYLKRSRSQSDERLMEITLTDLGKTTKEQLPEVSRQVFQEIHQKNPAIDYQQLQQFLQQLNLVFKK